jgi:hypothetical protein
MVYAYSIYQSVDIQAKSCRETKDTHTWLESFPSIELFFLSEVY